MPPQLKNRLQTVFPQLQHQYLPRPAALSHIPTALVPYVLGPLKLVCFSCGSALSILVQAAPCHNYCSFLLVFLSSSPLPSVAYYSLMVLWCTLMRSFWSRPTQHFQPRVCYFSIHSFSVHQLCPSPLYLTLSCFLVFKYIAS